MILKRMLNRSSGLDATFQALADPGRRAILEHLSKGPASVSQLAQPFEISLPAIMQHLSVLEDAGLVRSEKVGRVRTCRIEQKALSAADAWIKARRREWHDQLADPVRSEARAPSVSHGI